jgi:16S rRNA (adenine1518-N6/adenine1519-N6)-dimethyltransferase
MFPTKKSLGQHFLRNERALSDMANAVVLDQHHTVLEIGPGEGVLTRKLLATGAHIVAVEKDDRLIPILSNMFETEIRNKKLTLIHGDVVGESMLETLANILPPRWVLIANIPYYITGLILRTFLDAKIRPADIVILVQKEVAEDIVARDHKESVGSIAVKIYGSPKIISSVPRGSFVPPPTVDSAILHIQHIRDPFENDAERKIFFHIVKTGFRSKRKTILNTLSTLHAKEEMYVLLSQAGIDPGTRPETLNPDDWMRLTKCLASKLLIHQD